ncbi:MAG: hypothetical protein QGG42_12915 [Phycisphaerae bacterium]|jgi:hypothetical protein|nr:hypothetical protein [Phycisphaerae bacterium]
MPSELELTDKGLFQMKIFAIGPLVVVTVCLLIGMLLVSQSGNDIATSGDGEVIGLLTNIVIGMTVVWNLASPLILKLILKLAVREAKRRYGTAENPLGVLFLRTIIRDGANTGLALLGILSIMVGARLGEMQLYVWLNLLPVAIVYVVIISTFPTRESGLHPEI